MPIILEENDNPNRPCLTACFINEANRMLAKVDIRPGENTRVYTISSSSAWRLNHMSNSPIREAGFFTLSLDSRISTDAELLAAQACLQEMALKESPYKDAAEIALAQFKNDLRLFKRSPS